MGPIATPLPPHHRPNMFGIVSRFMRGGGVFIFLVSLFSNCGCPIQFAKYPTRTPSCTWLCFVFVYIAFVVAVVAADDFNAILRYLKS